jgi:soluble epoxide hydrolase/lipid-phosphate phosphatase
MDQFERKTLTTCRNLTYTYYFHSVLGDHDRPTLLLQHGFPDDHSVWFKVVENLLKFCPGYSILVPDLLGYSGTSKPTDSQSYNSKGMADDLAEILDQNGILKVVSIGHDWGCFIASRMWIWHPDRVVGVVLLNVAYRVPGPFDLDTASALIEKLTGVSLLAYWYFLTEPDAPALMKQNIESCWDALHGKPEDWYGTLLCHRGALRDFLANDKRIDVKPYAEDARLRENWIGRFIRDGFDAPVQWYHAQVNGHHWNAEKDLPRERWVVSVPLLYLGATNDDICPPSAIEGPQKAGFLPHLTTKLVKCGHWQPLEAPEASAKLIAEWLEDQNISLLGSRI